MGEDVTDMATTTSQLQAKLLALTGGKVDIMLDTNTFKNTTQILREMAGAWENMNDIQRASALELMGGKRQANTLSALIQNFETVEEAIEASAKSAGSALAENERYLDSIQGRIDQFNNALQSMWNNVLDDDLIKLIIQAGTELIKIVDNVGVLKTLIFGIGTYLIQKNFKGDLFGGLFNAQSIDEAKDRLKNLQAEIKELQGKEPSKRNDRKINRKQQQADTLGTSIDKYDELSKQLTKNRIDADAAKKALDEYNESLAKKYSKKKNQGKSPTDEEIAKLQDLQNAYDGANKKIAETEADLQKVEVQAKATGTAGLNAGNKIKTGFISASKTVGKFAGQLIMSMAHMAAITAAMELVAKAGDALWSLFDNANETTEELQERFNALNAELESAESEVEKLTSELDATNEALTELLAKDAPSFVEKEELERLQTQSAELERQVTLAKELRDNLQVSVNEAAMNATGAYLNETSFASETSKSERVEEAGSTGKAIGTVVGYAAGTAAGTAIGAKIGGTIGSFAGPIGTAIGVVAGGILGTVVGEAIGGADYEEEQTVQEAIDSMPEQRAELKKARDDAYEAYSKNPEDEDLKTAWNEASANLATYDQNMAKHVSQIQQAYNAIEITADTDASTKAYKQQLGDIIDQYNMAMGGEGAKEVAINRVFDDGGFEDAKKAIDYYVQALSDGDKSAAGAIEEIINDSEELKEAFSAKNLDPEEAIKYFTQIGEAANFSTINGKTEEIKRATEKLPEAFNNIGQFMDGDTVDKTAIADYFKGTSDKTREEIAQLIQDVNDGKIDVDNALKKFELFGVQSVVEIEISEVQTNFKNTFTDLENADGLINTFQELADAIGSTSKAMDSLNAAQAEMDYSGRVSIETALKLMESTDDYSKVLTISEGKLVLAEDAEENLINARIEGMKASALKALEEAKAARETTVLARSTAETALSTYNSAIESEMAAAVTATAWDKVLAAAAGLWAGIKSLFTDESWTEAYNRAYQETLNSLGGDRVAEVEAKYATAEEQAKKAQLEKDIENANKAIEEQDKEIAKLQGNYDLFSGLNKDNIGDVFKSDDLEDPDAAKEKKLDEAMDRFQKEMDYWENRIGANQAKYEQLQNEIDLLEKKGQKANAEYYNDQIKFENERLDLLNAQKTEAKKYLTGFYNEDGEWVEALKEGSEEWF